MTRAIEPPPRAPATAGGACLLVALAGCLGVDGSLEADWEPTASIDGALAPELGPTPVPLVPPATGVLRLVTWNVHFAADPDALARALARSSVASADLIMIQEVEAYPDEPASRTQRMAEALGMTWVYAPARSEGGGTHGIALLSRYPIASPRIMRLPHADAAWNARERAALAADVVLGDRLLPIVCVHLDVRIGAIDRIRQLHPAVIDLPEAVVVGGDFNTNPWTWVGSAIPLTAQEAIAGQDQAVVIDDYLGGLGFTSPIAPERPTFHVPLIAGRLDNLYVRGMPVVGADVATDVDGSDHWPVWTDIALP